MRKEPSKKSQEMLEQPRAGERRGESTESLRVGDGGTPSMPQTYPSPLCTQQAVLLPPSNLWGLSLAHLSRNTLGQGGLLFQTKAKLSCSLQSGHRWSEWYCEPPL